MLSLIRRGISRRIGIALALAMTGFGLGGVLLAVSHNTRTQRQISKSLLTTVSRTVSSSFSSFDPRLGQHPINDITVELGAMPEIERCDVFDHHGRVRWSTDARRRGAMMPADVLTVFTASASSSLEEKTRVLVPLRRKSNCLPCHSKSPDPIGGLLLAANEQQLFGGLENFGPRAIVTLSLFIASLTALLLLLMNRVVVTPLKRLLQVMAAAEEGDFLARAEIRTNDEIGMLGATFNRLLAKITDLRVESIDTEREMSEVKDELSLKSELSKKSELLEATNDRLTRKLNQLSFLNQLASDLASKLDLDYTLDRFCKRVTEDLKVPEFAVLLFDRSSGQIRVIKERGFEDEAQVIGQPFDITEGISGEAVTTKKPIYVTNLAEDGRRVAYRADPPAGSVLFVPMVYQDRVIGLLNFSSPVVDAFRESDQELFVTVANQAALALANAQLFQETLELSITDGLTGILNRRAMESRLDLEWSRALRDKTPISIVMVDIDHFKVYNDQHGHQLGDETLRRVAQILSRSIRRVDATARYGGEEFVVILPRAGKKEAIEVARKLRRSVEQADFVRGYLQPLGRVTISCGVATSPEDADTIGELVSKADEALFAAKQAGRNKVRAVSPDPAKPFEDPGDSGEFSSALPEEEGPAGPSKDA